MSEKKAPMPNPIHEELSLRQRYKSNRRKYVPAPPANVVFTGHDSMALPIYPSHLLFCS